MTTSSRIVCSELAYFKNVAYFISTITKWKHVISIFQWYCFGKKIVSGKVQQTCIV